MINHRLWKELDKVAFRIWRLRFWSALAAAWLLAALVGTLFWATGLPPGGNSRVVAPVLCGLAALLAGICLWRARAPAPDYLAVGRPAANPVSPPGARRLAAPPPAPTPPTPRAGGPAAGGGA